MRLALNKGINEQEIFQMARTFQLGGNGIEAMMTDTGSVLNTETSADTSTVVNGNIATMVQNPDFQADVMPSADVSNVPVMDM